MAQLGVLGGSPQQPEEAFLKNKIKKFLTHHLLSVEKLVGKNLSRSDSNDVTHREVLTLKEQNFKNEANRDEKRKHGEVSNGTT